MGKEGECTRRLGTASRMLQVRCRDSAGTPQGMHGKGN